MMEQRLYRQHIWNQCTSRRRMLKGAALSGAGLAAAAVLGCRREERAAPESVAQRPKSGGTLRHIAGIDLLGAGFDPHRNAAVPAEPFSLYYQGLVGYDAHTYEVMPELARRWEQPSPTELVFGLQPGVKWHNKPPANGRLLTAEDVVFSLERTRTNEPLFVHRSLFEAVDRIQAVEGATLRFTLKEPDAGLLAKLSMPGPFVLNPDVVEKTGGRFNSPEAVVGTGPFIMTAYEERVSAEYVRNPDSWKPGLPYLDRFHETVFQDDQTAWAAFLAGQLDMTRVPGTEVKKYLAQQGPNFVPLWAKPFGYVIVQANVRRPLMADPRVPRALRLLLDHDEVAKVAETQSGRTRHGFILPLAAEAWDFSHEEYYRFLEWKQPKDDAVKTALDLLNAAGFNRTNPLRFDFHGHALSPESATISQLIQEQWRRLSQGTVDPDLKPFDRAMEPRLQATRDFTVIRSGFSSWSDPDVTFSLQVRSNASRNYSGFSDTRADEMIQKQRHTLNLEERKRAVTALLIYLIDHYPGTIPTLTSVLTATKPAVRGAPPVGNASFAGRAYEQVWLDT